MESLFQLYYQKYRHYFFTIIIILSGIFIFYKITLPLFDEIGKSLEKIDDQKKEINDLNNTLTILNTLSEEAIDQDLSTANTALPSNKDFLAIYLGILRATSNSQTTLVSFSSKIGTIYKTEGFDESIPTKPRSTKTQKTKETQNPSVTVTAVIKASTVSSFQDFSDEITNILPLADVKKMTYADGEGELELAFFYKEYDLKNFAKIINIQPLSPQQQKLLQDLSAKKQ